MPAYTGFDSIAREICDIYSFYSDEIYSLTIVLSSNYRIITLVYSLLHSDALSGCFAGTPVVRS